MEISDSSGKHIASSEGLRCSFLQRAAMHAMLVQLTPLHHPGLIRHIGCARGTEPVMQRFTELDLASFLSDRQGHPGMVHAPRRAMVTRPHTASTYCG